jgi:pimeloyl-ACP methyl ester carboxylesterase
MSYLTTADGARLYVKDWGHGRPVVMAHGWPLSADTFDDLSLALTEGGFRAISYDRRGFGRSDQTAGGYDYDSLADDLAAVLQHTGAEDATLLGFSMGGGEVARYLKNHAAQPGPKAQQKVRQAVLVSSVLPCMLQHADNPQGLDAEVFASMAKALRSDRAAFWPGFFKDFYGVGLMSHPVGMETLEAACRSAMQAGLLPTLACLDAFANTDFRPDLKAFKLPTLIIHGGADKIVPVDTGGRSAARALPEARYIEYEGGCHGLLASHRQRLASDVLAFLRS